VKTEDDAKPISTTEFIVQTDDEVLLWLLEGVQETEAEVNDSSDPEDCARRAMVIPKEDLELRDSLISLWADFEVACTQVWEAWYINDFDNAHAELVISLEDSFAETLARRNGFYLTYMTLTGTGVGLNDGRLDDLFVAGTFPESLIDRLESTLGGDRGFASDAGSGRLVEEFSRCCYPLVCPLFTDSLAKGSHA
jgi:hypothetical protein